jgi:hypothetical protein
VHLATALAAWRGDETAALLAGWLAAAGAGAAAVWVFRRRERMAVAWWGQ